jgi:GalNAc-alpha-(1->4)-GalNAc-alpha-(1->3)-diNAcBac-PP-undecaprenol alpha-1,4-N-acetyl-D-galactosaminyltransferase
MKVTVVVYSLAGGGAERIAAMLAGYLARSGHQVDLVTVSDASQRFYEVDPSVRILPLGVARVSSSPGQAIANNIRTLRTLRRAIQSGAPDCVVSLGDTTNIQVLLSVRLGLRIPVVISERTDPREYGLAAPWRLLRRLLYPAAATLVVQTGSVREWAEKIMAGKPVAVIPNPAIRRDGLTLAPEVELPRGPFISAMGRLVREKGFDILLRAFAKLRNSLPDWSLVIMGEGELRPRLERLAVDLGVAGRVLLPGLLRHPESVLSRSAMFVLSSRREGFPNALLEAMACRLPVISTDCRSGPGEIVRNEINGLLVPPDDVDALSAAIGQLAADASRRRRLAGAAVAITAELSPARCFGLWTDAINHARSVS